VMKTAHEAFIMSSSPSNIKGVLGLRLIRAA